MMLAPIAWILAVTAIGWIAFPLAFHLLKGLPGRGYAFSKALGLLLTVFVYWLLGSLGFLNNSLGGIIFALVVVLTAGLWIAFAAKDGEDQPIGAWIRENSRLILSVEALFIVTFVGWTLFRAYNPDILGTEKPMELAFLNGIRASASFPPQDPWLSGYAISYYYFGYVIMAMLADLTGTISSVAFNLGIALLFSLTCLSSYGMVYNLVAAHRIHKKQADPLKGLAASALIGPVMIAIMGNLEGLFDLLHALNVPFLGSRFWQWLDIININEASTVRLWPPDTWRSWWWWRASRVIHERTPAGVSSGLQPIDEFPFFSFLLGDMHPHVLALPFVILALALAFNLLRQREALARTQYALYAVVFGGLAFLNTWDLPFYFFVLLAAFVLRAIQGQSRPDIRQAGQGILKALGVLVAGIVLVIPWLISFGSQAGGILPNAIFATRFHQLFVMFGPMFVILVWFLAGEGIRRAGEASWGRGLALAFGLLVLLIVLMAGLGLVVLRVDAGARAFFVTSAGIPIDGLTPDAISALLPEAIRTVALHRLSHPLTPLFLTLVIAAVVALLLPRRDSLIPAEESSPSTLFALVLILTGTLLLLGPEFLYLRDIFGQRINTIFKFYYIAWVTLGLAAAYAMHVILARQRIVGRVVFSVVSVLLIAAGLTYTAIAIPTRADFTSADLPTLDGLDYVRRIYPADYAGILWLQENAGPDAVVLEAVGGAYSRFARVSSSTGLPTVLGWPNHERQWRGDQYAALAGTREDDIREIYNTPSISRAQDLLEQYNVTYIFVGTLERSPEYASAEGIAKFDRALTAVFQADGVTIYRADQPLVEETP